MRIICFLRELELPIDAISQLLKEEHPEKVISLLIEQQENALSEEIARNQEKLEKLRELKSGLKNRAAFSLESIGDIAVIMEGKKKLKSMRWTIITKAGSCFRCTSEQRTKSTGRQRKCCIKA